MMSCGVTMGHWVNWMTESFFFLKLNFRTKYIHLETCNISCETDTINIKSALWMLMVWSFNFIRIKFLHNLLTKSLTSHMIPLEHGTKFSILKTFPLKIRATATLDLNPGRQLDIIWRKTWQILCTQYFSNCDYQFIIFFIFCWRSIQLKWSAFQSPSHHHICTDNCYWCYSHNCTFWLIKKRFINES